MTRTLNLLAFVVFASSLFIALDRSGDPADRARPRRRAGDGGAADHAFTPALRAGAAAARRARRHVQQGAADAALPLHRDGGVDRLRAGAEFPSPARRAASWPGWPPAASCRSRSRWSATSSRCANGRWRWAGCLFAIMTGNLLGATCAGVIGDLVGWRGVFFATGRLRRAGAGRLGAGSAQRPGCARPLRPLDVRAELPRHLQQPAGEDLLRRCVPRSRVHVRRLSLRRDDAAAGGRDRASIAGVVIAGFGVGGALYGVFVSRLLPLLGETRMMRIGGAAMALCLVDHCAARAMAGRVRQFRAARLRLLHAARGHPDLRQRAGAGGARFGHGAAFVLLLSRAGGWTGGLRRGFKQHRP